MGQTQPPQNPMQLSLDDTQESAWLEVIHKMDEVYSDLLEREVDLESKNAQLEEANEFIDSILEAMSDVVVVCDRVGRIVKVNRPLLALSGFVDEDLIGRPIGVLFGIDFEKHFGDLVPGIGGEARLSDFEAVLLQKNGAPGDPVSLNASVRHNAKGFVDGLVLVGRPVGELRQAYDALNRAHEELKTAQSHLLQSEKMASIGRLVAGVAHELNNPISFLYANVHSMESYSAKMKHYIEALRDLVPTQNRQDIDANLKIDRVLEDLPSLLEGTREGAERVSAIVNNLRRLSFHDDHDKAQVDLIDIVTSAVRFAGKNANRDGIVELDLPEKLYVHGSANRLHQVFLNIVENALDAVSDQPDPQICICAEQDQDTLRLHIRDNGGGFQETDTAKLFDPFFTTKAVGQGTGLGLWISYEIIQDHGGEIIAQNSPDGGAHFIITLARHAQT